MLKKESVEKLKKKYPRANDVGMSFLIDYELNEFAFDLPHPEYEKEAFDLITS